jgi:hypothetical protein
MPLSDEELREIRRLFASGSVWPVDLQGTNRLVRLGARLLAHIDHLTAENARLRNDKRTALFLLERAQNQWAGHANTTRLAKGQGSIRGSDDTEALLFDGDVAMFTELSKA